MPYEEDTNIHCGVAGEGKTMSITIEESPEEAIETFARLSTLGHFSKAAKLFEDVLKPYLVELPVFAEYANFLIQQGNYGVLLDCVNERIRMRDDPKPEVPEEETVYLELLRALSMLHFEGQLVKTLEALKPRSTFYQSMMRPPIEPTYIQIRSVETYLAIITAAISIMPKTSVEYTNNVTIRLSDNKSYVFETGATTSSESPWHGIQAWCVLLAENHPQEALNIFRMLLNVSQEHHEKWCWGFTYSLGSSHRESQASFKLARVGAINAWISHCRRHRPSWAYEDDDKSLHLLNEIYSGDYDRRSQQFIEMKINEIAVRRKYGPLPGLAEIAREECNHRLESYCFELMFEASGDKGMLFSTIAPVLEFQGGPYSHIAQDAVELVTILDRLFTNSLHKTVSIGSLAAVRLLIDRGDDLRAKTQGGRNFLHQAAYKGYKDIAQLLCSHDESLLSSVAKNGYLPLHLAAENGHEALIPLLTGSKKEHLDTHVKSPPQQDSSHSRSNDDGTALHLASANGHEGVVSSLLDCKSKVDERDAMGWTALHKSCARWQYGVASILLRHGADVNSKTDKGLTALVLAIKTGHTALVDLLLQHHAVSGSDGSDRSALSFAAENGDLETAKSLLGHGQDIHTAPEKGKSPLQIAVQNGHLHMVRLFLEKNPHFEEKDGQMTALHFAAREGHSELVELILGCGANIEARDADQRTALHCAAREGNLRAMKTLLEHGADPDAQDNYGTALHHTASRPKGHPKKLLVAKMLLEHKANIGVKTVQGSWTALHIAARDGDKVLVELLLKNLKVKSVLTEVAGEGQQAKTPAEWAQKNWNHAITTLIEDAEKYWKD